MIEEKSGNDDDATEGEHQEHHRHQRALVELDATQVDDHEGPEEREGDTDAHRTGLECRGNPCLPHRRGDEDDIYAFPRILVVTQGDERVGVMADRVARVTSVSAQDLQGGLELTQNPRIAEFSSGEVETEDRLLAVLNTASLLDAARVSE